MSTNVEPESVNTWLYICLVILVIQKLFFFSVNYIDFYTNFQRFEIIVDVLLFLFKKTVGKSHQILIVIMIREKGRLGDHWKFERVDLQVLLDKNNCQTQKQLQSQLNLAQKFISNLLRPNESSKKSVVHELTDGQLICELLFVRYKRNSYCNVMLDPANRPNLFFSFFRLYNFLYIFRIVNNVSNSKQIKGSLPIV